MARGMLGILELGTNSVKLHLCGDEGPAPSEPLRAEWEIGYEICASGSYSEKGVNDALDVIAGLLDSGRIDSLGSFFGVATGVFDEIEGADGFLAHVHERFGAPIRVLDGDEQARLLYLGFASGPHRRPALVFDLGCGRLEIVYLGVGAGARYLHESLPLGAILVQQMAARVSGQIDVDAVARYIDVKLRDTVKPLHTPVVHGTGGSVRAIARVVASDEVDLEALKRVEDDAIANGPPDGFSPRRQATFLPGVMMVRRLLEHVDARTLRHRRIDLGRVLIDRLMPLHREMGSRLQHVFIDRQIDILSW